MATQPRDDGPASGGSISYSKVIDLSWPVHPGIPQWPGDPGVEFETVADVGKDGYFLRWFSMGEHSGTHLSAPSSFYPGAPGHQGFLPQDLVRPAIVIDITAKAEADQDYALTMNDVLDWESDHGPVPDGCVAMLRAYRLTAKRVSVPGSAPAVSVPSPATFRPSMSSWAASKPKPGKWRLSAALPPR